MENTWSRFLNESGFCMEDPTTGNRPCDSGYICDRCHADEVQRDYEIWKAARKSRDKKEIIKLLEQHFGVKAKYLGIPSFAHQIKAGEEIYTITREGHIEDSAGRKIDLASIISSQSNEETVSVAEQGLDEVEIILPLAGHTGTSLKNMVNMIFSKQTLIKKTLGIEGNLIDDELAAVLKDKKPESLENFKALLSETKSGAINFDFEQGIITFRFGNLSPEQIKACTELAALINNTAKNLKHVSSKPVETDNEKYAFRTWLLRLGMIGSEYQASRKTLLANLEGNGAFRNPGTREGNEQEVRIMDRFFTQQHCDPMRRQPGERQNHVYV